MNLRGTLLFAVMHGLNTSLSLSFPEVNLDNCFFFLFCLCTFTLVFWLFTCCTTEFTNSKCCFVLWLCAILGHAQLSLLPKGMSTSRIQINFFFEFFSWEYFFSLNNFVFQLLCEVLVTMIWSSPHTIIEVLNDHCAYRLILEFEYGD